MIEIALTLLCVGVTMMAINGASTYLIYLAMMTWLGTATFVHIKYLRPALDRRKIDLMLKESRKYQQFIKESETK